MEAVQALAPGLGEPAAEVEVGVAEVAAEVEVAEQYNTVLVSQAAR